MAPDAAIHLIPRPANKHLSIDEGLRLRIQTLLTERETLQEEVRQLSAAVAIYREVVRRMESGQEPLRAA